MPAAAATKTPAGPLQRAWRFCVDWVTHFIDDDCLTLAAAISFDLLFALVPFLIFLVTLAGWLGQSETALESINIGLSILPNEVARVVKPLVDEVRNASHPSLLTISMLGTIWVASNTLESARNALNRAFEATVSPREWPLRRLQGLLFTLIAGLAVLLVTGATVILPIFLDIAAVLLAQPDLPARFDFWLTRVASLVLLFLVVLALYRLLPGRRMPYRALVIGAAFVAVVWTVSVTVFSYYLGHISRMTVTYGSLGGVIVTMFFFWWSSNIFLLGAELAGTVARLTPAQRHAPLSAAATHR